MKDAFDADIFLKNGFFVQALSKTVSNLFMTESYLHARSNKITVLISMTQERLADLIERLEPIVALRVT